MLNEPLLALFEVALAYAHEELAFGFSPRRGENPKANSSCTRIERNLKTHAAGLSR